MLDLYLYRRNKKRKRITIKDSNKELIELLEKSPIKELRELKEYSQYIDKPFIECLKEAINDYVGVISGGLQSEEVSHSKGLWSVLCMFHDYNESGRNRVLKQELEEGGSLQILPKVLSDSVKVDGIDIITKEAELYFFEYKTISYAYST